MAKLFVSGLLAASMLLGGLSYRRYVGSERQARAFAVELRARGAGLDGEGCVAQVLEWGKRCDAMQVVCEAAITPLLKTCLEAADRTAYCRSLGAVLDTHFSYARCHQRGYGRRNRVCAEAYLTVADHCQTLLKGAHPEARP